MAIRAAPTPYHASAGQAGQKKGQNGPRRGGKLHSLPGTERRNQYGHQSTQPWTSPIRPGTAKRGATTSYVPRGDPGRGRPGRGDRPRERRLADPRAHLLCRAPLRVHSLGLHQCRTCPKLVCSQHALTCFECARPVCLDCSKIRTTEQGRFVVCKECARSLPKKILKALIEFCKK
jgi:hypothetical protein